MSELKVNKISANDDSTSIEISSKVGIGTTTPPGILSIDGSALTGIPGIHLTGFTDSELDIAVEDGEALQIGEWNSSTDTATLNMIIKNNGKVGIGTSSPVSAFTIKQSADNDTGGITIIESDDDNDIWTIFRTNSFLKFNRTTAGAGSFADIAHIDPSSPPGEIDFTGQHRSDSSEELKDSSNIGRIVSATGVLSNLGTETLASINESLPVVELSTGSNDKRVYGVISSIEDPNTETREYSSGNFISSYPSQDTRLVINALGEGALWVTNFNGDLENGDYITSCEIPGYGMKQDDDILHNYTVAKITQDCTFDIEAENYICEEIEHNEQTYKRAFVGCTYHCG